MTARIVAAIVGAVAVLVVLFAPRDAAAYPWMIRHDYAACATCHADPSGAGILTTYGRAQGEILLRTHYGRENPEDSDVDPAKIGGFAFGVVTLPEWLQLQIDARALYMHLSPPSPAPSTDRVILMQADAAAAINVGRFRSAGSLGYLHEGGLAASVTRGDDRLVSRYHWAGVALGEDDAFLLRAGRMNLPYGLRIIEHTSFVRASTRTDINASQQHGVALSFNRGGWRAEGMAIAGNFQLGPDALRERGIVGYGERAFTQKLAVGVTSLVTHVDHDLDARTATFRQAHGVFGRFAPVKPVVIMAEADVLVRSPKRRDIAIGSAGFLQVDVEPIQGVHVAATGELLVNDVGTEPTSFGGWLSAFWFFLPHVDVRADVIQRAVAAGDTRAGITMFLAQIHGRL